MAYTDTDRSRNRTATLITVAALHVAAGYVLVNGLAAKVLPFLDDRITTVFIPSDPPKPPPPTPQPTDKAAPDNSRVTVTDLPFAIPTAAPTFAASNEEDTRSAGDDLGTVLYPVATPTPEPLPTPRFAPKAAVPLGNPARWVSPDDYPTAELRREHEGTTRFRLGIGSDGRVTSCTITATSGWPGLDAAACTKLTARAKFRPATGEGGEAVAGSYANKVLWDIPEE